MSRFSSAIVSTALLLATERAESKTLGTRSEAEPAFVPRIVTQVQNNVSANTPRLLKLFRDLREIRAEAFAARAARVSAAELSALGFDVSLDSEGTEMLGSLHDGSGPTLLYEVTTATELGAAELAAASAAAETGPSSRPVLRRQDAQVAWSLGMARALVALRSQWAGTLVLHARPAASSVGESSAGTPPDLRVRGAAARWSWAMFPAPTPLGSVLRMRGLHRAGAAGVEVTFDKWGEYVSAIDPAASAELAAPLVRNLGLPDNVPFRYFLVGVVAPSLEADTLDDGDPLAPEEGAAPAPAPSPAAIPLGSTLAALSVLELLYTSPVNARPGSSLDFTLHPY